MAEEQGYAMDWDSESAEDNGFELLPEGVYEFNVVGLDRARYEGGAKIGPCPKAVIKMVVMTDTGLALIEESLLLHSKVQFKIAQFFASLGYEKDPETGRVPIRWNEIEGKSGHLRLAVHEYTKRDGSVGKSNRVEKFLKPSEVQAELSQPTQTAIPVPEQPAPAPKHYEI